MFRTTLVSDVDHPACSMILDDTTYVKEKLFITQEIDELKKEAPMDKILRISQDLGNYIDHFNCDNLRKLRMRLADTQGREKEEYDMNKHHYLDWIKHDIHSNIQTLRVRRIKYCPERTMVQQTCMIAYCYSLR